MLTFVYKSLKKFASCAKTMDDAVSSQNIYFSSVLQRSKCSFAVRASARQNC